MYFQKPCTSFAAEDRLAVCSPDGVLHLWDVKTGEQSQQFTPASHLTSSFTCLSWKLSLNIKKQDKPNFKSHSSRKKLKTSKTTTVEECIALGTITGDIMLYDASNNELFCKYKNGHQDRVNDIQWSNGNTFYSCSTDKNIIEWDINDTSPKSKWSHKGSVYSIKVGPHCRTLLSAGTAIKLWDLKTKTLLRKYSGHASPISSLYFVNFQSQSPGSDMDTLDAVHGVYILSAAMEDTAITAWQIHNTKPKKGAVASFLASRKPQSMDVFTSTATFQQAVHMLCVTEEGEIMVFEHQLNGRNVTPIEPKHTIKYADEEGNPMDIIHAKFSADTNTGYAVLIIAYGTTSNVAFDKLNLKEHASKEIFVVRKDPTKMKIALETAHNLKMREPIVNRDQVTALAPGAAGHSTNIQGKKPTKRKNDTTNADEKSAQPSMEDRLAILNFDESSKTADAVPTVRADSLSMLLSQGLQSNDSSILNQVLQQKNDKLIANTVKQLPIQAVMPLIKILNEKLDGTPEKCLIYIKWTRSVMLQHMSYLLTLPNVVPILGRMHQLISIRTKTHNRLSNLEGKLDLILTQVLIKESPQVDETSQEALIFFQEESSDEEDGFSFSDDDQQDDDWDNDFDFTDDGGGDEQPKTNGPQHLDEEGEEEEDEDEEMEEEE